MVVDVVVVLALVLVLVVAVRGEGEMKRRSRCMRDGEEAAQPLVLALVFEEPPCQLNHPANLLHLAIANATALSAFCCYGITP